jgi:hypothetical protein
MTKEKRAARRRWRDERTVARLRLASKSGKAKKGKAKKGMVFVERGGVTRKKKRV